MILFFAYILNIIDYLFTSYWISLYGLSVEGNPIGQWMFQNNEAFYFKFVIVPILLSVLGMCIQKNPKAAWVAYIPFVAYGLMTIYHIGLLIYINFI